MEKDKMKYRKQQQDTPKAKPSLLQIGESFGRNLTPILNQMLQVYNPLFQTQKIKAKRKIKVLPFGIIQERDTDRMIDQIQMEITRIFSQSIIIEMSSDHKIEDKEEEEEITEEKATEEIKVALIEITEQQTHIITVITVTVVPDLTQKQVAVPTPQLVKTPDSWKSNKTPTPKQLSKLPTLTQITTDDDYDSNDDVFSEVNLIQLQVRGPRGRGKKSRGIKQSKLEDPGQRRGKTGAANETINSSAQSSHMKQIAGGSDFNFGSSMDIDMEQMMQRDLTQTLHSSNDGPIVSTALPQLGTNDENEMNILQQGHLAAQRADGLGFQLLIGQEQEQSEDDPEQDQGQLDLNNLPDDPGNEGPPGLTQETRRSEAKKRQHQITLKIYPQEEEGLLTAPSPPEGTS
ncbi:MAG: hypothetical protein EZS28_004473 [Streblomastix strix]|uniref:Uncharacterized protein n=1 Tax=Streblomastix strix TaxID=222440 RepID=A0A5J4WY32_9EUKA|nr:MAG: hypothetical protein EZS28_004473 [Streblomastix strix]